MFRNLIWIAVLAVLLLGVVASQRAFTEPDPVLASFERQFDREPVTAARPSGDAIDDDELYERLNAVHWTQDKPMPVQSEDSIEGENDDETDSYE